MHTQPRLLRAKGQSRGIHGSLVLVMLVGFSGCAIHRARVAHEAESKLIGLSEEQLLQCAGAPAHEKRLGSLSFLTYHGGGDGVAVGEVLGRSQIGVAAYKHRYCDATFTLRNGLVADLQYRGRTGGLLTRGEQCAFIVEDCVAR